MINIPVNRPVFRPIHQLITEYYGTGYVPSIMLDFTTGTLDSRINFSRTTNATVTNSAGLITYAPHNLLTHSEQFDNAAWTKINSTITANNANAPDGYQTADTVTFTAPAEAQLFQYITLTVSQYVISIYAKVNSGTKLFRLKYFNGTTDTYSSNFTATTTWQRFEFTITGTASSGNIAIVNGSTAVAGDLIIWGAQLEIGSTATTYNSTTVKNLLGYSELFDNAAWTKSNSFVQTNLLTYSEAFDNAAWTKSNTTVVENTTIAPNGYQTADKIVEDSASSAHAIKQTIITVIGNTYTLSFYAKAAEKALIQFYAGGSDITGNPKANFDLANGVLGTVDAGITASISLVSNDYYRCTLTFTAASTSFDILIGGITSTTSSRGEVYLGTLGAGFYLWGAQLVQGSVAGDYRRTDAAALPVYYPNHNGVVCAEKLVENTATNSHFIQQSSSGLVTGGIYTWTIYAKAAERNFYAFVLQDTSGFYTTYFNLATGLRGTVPDGITASIVPVGNGWHRCSVTKTISGTTATIYPSIASANGSTSYTGDGTSGVYIFGAQLSDSASLDPYVLNAAAAPTAAAYYGARFDYDPVTLAPKGLLIEEQRVNSLTYSSDFSNVAWVKGSSTITTDTVISPDGTLTGDKLVENTAVSTLHYVFQSFSATAQAYTLSCFLKSAERTQAKLDFVGGTNGAIFDLGTGSIVSSSGAGLTASINNVGNGWYRCIISQTQAAGSITPSITLAINGSTSYTGNGTSGIYIWGAQLEAGAFATSYIPTAASQVTRAADVATIQGSNFYSWYNQNEGTLVGVGSSIPSNSVTTGSIDATLASVNDTSIANSMAIMRGDSGNALSRFNGIFATVGQFNIRQSVWSANSLGKISGAYKINDFAMSFNGGNATTDSLGTAPIVSQLNIGGYTSAAGNWDGTIKSISYYPQRLSNDVLKGLTA